jgi:hypothetical protein
MKAAAAALLCCCVSLLQGWQKHLESRTYRIEALHGYNVFVFGITCLI